MLSRPAGQLERRYNGCIGGRSGPNRRIRVVREAGYLYKRSPPAAAAGSDQGTGNDLLRFEGQAGVGYIKVQEGADLSAAAKGIDPREVGLDDGTLTMDVKLIMFREDGSKRVFPLGPGGTTIGRKDDCDIRIPLAVVSRHHAEVVLEEDGAVIKDLGAANGTFLNNRRIDEEDLEPGDQIMIGPVVFTVLIDGSPGDDELVEIRTKVLAGSKVKQHSASVGTSKHVYTSEEEIDPISALEELASSADQTAIHPEEDE